MKTLRMKIWSHSDAPLLFLFAVLCFVFLSGKEWVASIDLSTGEKVVCQNTCIFGVVITQSTIRGESLFSELIGKYHIKTFKEPIFAYESTTWENILGHRTFADGYLGIAYMKMAKRFKDAPEAGGGNIIQDYTRAFYEILNSSSAYLLISDKPFCDVRIESKNCILEKQIGNALRGV